MILKSKYYHHVKIIWVSISEKCFGKLIFFDKVFLLSKMKIGLKYNYRWGSLTGVMDPT